MKNGRALPPLAGAGQPEHGIAQGLSILGSHQGGVVLPQVHQPEHGPQGLQLRLGKVKHHLGAVQVRQPFSVQQVQFHDQTPVS